MHITIRLFATLRANRGKVIEQNYDHNPTCYEVLESLAIEEKDVAIFLVNGRDSCLSKVLEEDDILSIFPPVGGG